MGLYHTCLKFVGMTLGRLIDVIAGLAFCPVGGICCSHEQESIASLHASVSPVACINNKALYQ
jgi:hypothetical protein